MSTAVTTGLFVLAGVVVGGLVTGVVNYSFEWRRERGSFRVAVRLLESELARAAAFADSRLAQVAWSPWDFESAHRTWSEYRSDIAIRLSADDWYSVSIGFTAIEQLERHFAAKPKATTLTPDDQRVLDTWSEDITAGANTLRRRLGLAEFGRSV